MKRIICSLLAIVLLLIPFTVSAKGITESSNNEDTSKNVLTIKGSEIVKIEDLIL